VFLTYVCSVLAFVSCPPPETAALPVMKLNEESIGQALWGDLQLRSILVRMDVWGMPYHKPE
jgi:hypothetical protein